MTTLAMILVIASVVALAQARANAGRLTYARLERAERMALAELAVRERLRLVLAEALTGGALSEIKLDGTPFTLEGADYRVVVRLNDVGGLADLYFAPPALLAALPDGAALAAARPGVLDGLAQGERFPVEEATLARFGANRLTRGAAVGLITQSGEPGALHAEQVPVELRAAAEAAGLMGMGSVRVVRVNVRADSAAPSK